MNFGKAFFEKYCANDFSKKTIVDVGAQDVNGSLREFCPEGANYIGVDFVGGKGVDVVLTDPYQLPFENESVDVVVCSSVFEHSEFFWLLFLECVRIVKPDGLIYLNAPSNGHVHRYPVDCWRFYPDAGRALVNWSMHNSYNTLLLESFIGEKEGPIDGDGMWNDFVAVILKDKTHESLYPSRILQGRDTTFCGYSSDCRNDFPMAVKNPDLCMITEQQGRIASLVATVSERGKELDELCKKYVSANALVEERGKELEELCKKNVSATALVEERGKELEELCKKNVSATALVEERGKELEELCKEHVSATALVEERGKDIEAYVLRIDALTVQLEEKKTELARLNGSIFNRIKKIFL